MSFSGDVKQELSYQVPSARHCRISEIYAILSFCSHVEEGVRGPSSVKMHTENLAVARKYFTLIKKTFNIKQDVSVRQIKPSRGGRSYEVTSYADISEARDVTVQRKCCRRAYIRGAFLAAGSISDPEKGYHLEIVCGTEEKAHRLQEMLESFGVEPKITPRKQNYVLYVKEGSQISDILNIMEAHVSMMNFENIRILREMRNTVNREVNCETANLNKTVSAAVRQIEDIRYIQSTIGLEQLPDNLVETAEMRLEHPDMTLKELGESLSTPLGKSGVNHRLRRLCKIAEELREQGGKSVL